jgi:hypothetical protein
MFNPFVFFSAIHVGAHVFNVQNLVLAWNHPDNNTAGLLSTLCSLPTRPNETYINFIRVHDAVSNAEAVNVIPDDT